MNTKKSTLSMLSASFSRKAFIFLTLLFTWVAFEPVAQAQATAGSGGSGDATIMGVASDSTTSPFINLQTKLKNFVVIVLLISLVLGAIMAGFGKSGWAMGVGIGGFILFGGAYILAMLQSGLQ